MQFSHRFLLPLVFIFVSSASFAQYKYDVGLRVSSHGMERFQLDTRFHLKSPYSVIVSLTSGSQIASSRNDVPVFGDSIYRYSSTFSERNNFGIKAGVQRKIGFLATDVFYAGASLGIGYQKSAARSSWSNYQIDSIVNHQKYTQTINSMSNSSYSRALKTDLTLTFGLDVPLSRRFSVNAEVGMITSYLTSLTSNSSFFTQQLYVSGGIRYSFGKRKK